MGVKWRCKAGREPLVLGDHCKNLEFQRCAQDIDTGAEKGSVSVWEYKGKWRQENVRNGPE
jgi:(p)ppGpp synthase/HD superfamily hydrolase